MIRMKPPGEIVAETPATPLLSVVIPVYRASRTLPLLCERLIAALSMIDGACEIVMVEDRSPDDSWEVLERMAELYPSIVAVRLSRNFGQHCAIAAGLDVATGYWTVTMDCDLQDQPEEIPKLLAVARQGFDVVLARRKRRVDGFLKRLFSRMFYGSFRVLSGHRMDPSVGSFRIMRRNVVDAYRSMREASRLFGGMIQWLGFETAYLDVQHAARHEGESTYNLRSLLRLALTGIIAFSNRPLYLSIVMGITMSLFAIGFGLKLVVGFLLHPWIGVPGWLSTVTLTTFIGGMILMNLGIIGIYIGKIYDETKARPIYVVDRIVAHGARAASVTASTESFLPGRDAQRKAGA